MPQDNNPVGSFRHTFELPAVDSVSCAIANGEMPGLVGESGSGKTTLVRLLNRLDDPDAGVVLLDGRDVRDDDVLELRRRVQLVGQVPVTFPGTVAHNVGDEVSLLARVGLGFLVGRRLGALFDP